MRKKVGDGWRCEADLNMAVRSLSVDLKNNERRRKSMSIVAMLSIRVCIRCWRVVEADIDR